MKRWGCMCLVVLLLWLAGCRAQESRPAVSPAGQTASYPSAGVTLPSKKGGGGPTATKTTRAGTSSAKTQASRQAAGSFGQPATAGDATGSGTASTTTASTATAAPEQALPSSETELRGVWITYSELDALLKGKTPEQAGKAIDDMMKNCASYGLNTVFFHVRANSDAYYASTLFPAAESVEKLLGQGFDPLERAVAAAHRYGLELHAWINPYRIGKDASRRQCDKTFSYQEIHYYIPHEPKVQQLVVDGVKEVVEGYDVDGVQFDDYFYPAGSLPGNAPASFEKAAYTAWKKEAGNQDKSVGDWRRSGVDSLIREVYQTVHARPDCVFGVSPSHDAEKNREQMYADTAGWMNRTGMVDYLCPQVYFGFENETAPFHKTVETWREYPRRPSVKLYVGLALYKIGQEDEYAGSGRDEWQTQDSIMARSVNWLRTRKDCSGFVFFSYRYFTPAACGLTGQAEKTAQKEVEQVLALMR